jgi:hypothetical protein
MLVIEIGCLFESDEKLTAICFRSTVSHAQNAGLGMGQLGVKFVCERFTKDAFTAGARACRVTALKTEILD